MMTDATMKGWSNLLAESAGEDEGADKTVVDYPEYIKALSEARAKYHDTHDMADYKAISAVREQYGISRDEEKPLSTILAMKENDLHKDGLIVCHIPQKEFEDMLNSGRWKELESRIKQAANPDVINKATGGRYPMLGELFKSNHKDSRLAMTAFGLYKDGDGYSVKVDPKNLELSNYEYFSKAIESLKAEKQQTLSLESRTSTNFENLINQQESQQANRGLHM